MRDFHKTIETLRAAVQHCQTIKYEAGVYVYSRMLACYALDNPWEWQDEWLEAV
jgi:hypothetical protein